MIAPWNRRSVYIDFSLENAKAIVEILKANGIEYYVAKRNNSIARGRAVYNGFDSDIGKTPETKFIYYVYVHRNDLEAAKQLQP